MWYRCVSKFTALLMKSLVIMLRLWWENLCRIFTRMFLRYFFFFLFSFFVLSIGTLQNLPSCFHTSKKKTGIHCQRPLQKHVNSQTDIAPVSTCPLRTLFSSSRPPLSTRLTNFVRVAFAETCRLETPELWRWQGAIPEELAAVVWKVWP